MTRFLFGWILATSLASVVVYQAARIEPAPLPSAAAQRWAMETLVASRTGATPAKAPKEAERYRAKGPLIALAWWQGRVQARVVGGPRFADSVRKAARRFATDAKLRALPGFAPDAENALRFTIAVSQGEGPWLTSIPYLSNLGIVPLVEGASAELRGRRAYLTPDEMVAAELIDRIRTPIPDLAIGVDLEGVHTLLAQQLDVSPDVLLRQGIVRRFVATTIAEQAYPSTTRVSVATLKQAARQGAEFLLRHQQRDGRYTYTYRAASGDVSRGFYSLPRHAGTTYFLAQADRVLGMPEARLGALRALRWVRRALLTRCGAEDRYCVRDGESADMGAAALTALAASELLRNGEDRASRSLLVGLLAFIRSMQRADGELMHVYDLAANKPIDVQQMYYSGEAADALFNSARVLDDERNLAAAKRLMQHLTGGAWDFFGSRYFYGEEHWTCQAVAQAAEVRDLTASAGDRAKRDPHLDRGLDFCLRWLAFQRALLYQRGETPWPVAGAIGVGPVIVPRLTTVASRVEAGAMIYRIAKARGDDVYALRAQMNAHLGLLLRMRWAPGPTHLFFDPKAAFGGLPATQASLDVRNDFVQHAGSAMLLWAEVLAEEGSQ